MSEQSVFIPLLGVALGNNWIEGSLKDYLPIWWNKYKDIERQIRESYRYRPSFSQLKLVKGHGLGIYEKVSVYRCPNGLKITPAFYFEHCCAPIQQISLKQQFALLFWLFCSQKKKIFGNFLKYYKTCLFLMNITLNITRQNDNR